MPKKWYQNWFSSPYYHILYHHRNDDEAEFFIDNLCTFLKPSSDSVIFDTASGRGRHAVYLNKKGYEVTGTDLSHANINYAKQFENDRLSFFEHDMRHLFYVGYFNIALNLFTSFGHYETQREHISTLKTIRKSLRRDGRLVLDYFNTEKIQLNLTRQEHKTVDNIDFTISRKIENGKIVKSISFEHRQKSYNFREEVKAFTFNDFQELFRLSGFDIESHFGDYSLNGFNPSKSDRLIFICKKNHA